MISLPAIRAVVKKEYLDSVRNKWILGVTFIFLLLALITSYFGAASSGGNVGIQGFKSTALLMGTTTILLIPIIALMLSFAAIAGEREQGSLALLLSLPLTRLELLLGKFLGLTLTLATTIVVGYGAAGVVVAAVAGTAYADAYLAMLGAAILLGTAFIALALFFSSLVQKRSSALGIGVFLWMFFAFLYTLILIGVYRATGGEFPDPSRGRFSIDFPDWYWGAQMFNPSQAFQLFLGQVFGETSAGGLAVSGVPGFVTTGSVVASLALWTLIPLLLAYLSLRRRDV